LGVRDSEESIKNYKELEVWQKGVDLTVQLYQITRAFPPEEKFGLVSQIRRAAASIPANIAEGWGRGSTKEYIQFLKDSARVLDGAGNARNFSVQTPIPKRGQT